MRFKKTLLALSSVGLLTIAGHEGFSEKPYFDSAGVKTIGFGDTRLSIHKQKIDVVSGLFDLGQNLQVYERGVKSCVNVPLAQREYDAYVSHAYNVGVNAFCESTIVKRANARDYAGACEAIMMWDKITINGKKVSCHDRKNNCYGIITRREQTRDYCLNG